MFKGLPGCGKSTKAEEMILAAPPGQAVRVNRDLLRIMLNADRWKGSKTEDGVVAARDGLISMFMLRGVPLIISDDTNFHPSCENMFKMLCAQGGYSFEVVDMTSVPVAECIARDLKRPKSVGEKVIKRMYRDYLEPKYAPVEPDPSLPNAILVDIDGTLAHMVAPAGGKIRSPYDYHRANEDALDEVVHDLVQDAHDRGYTVIVMSGRDEECRDVSEAWLAAHGIKYEAFYMRKRGDTRKDSVVKSELFDAHILGKYNVRYVLDDRDQVVVMWRERGLKVLQVAPGDF